jgi:uncharacterized beta barrel domain-containing protein DUF5777
VITRLVKSLLSLFFVFVLLSIAASPALAQTEDDDAVLQPAEPDYRVVNLPTTLRLPLYKSNFELTHRFNGNLRRGDFGDQASSLFGIDQGATIGFEYRFAPLRHVEVAVYRENYDKTIQMYGKWDALHQKPGLPLSVSGLLSVEGGNNFRERYATSVGATLSRQIDDAAALYAVPMWVHNTTPLASQITGITNNTFFIGLGGRVRIRPTVYISAEVSPRVAGLAGNTAEYGFAIEKRTGSHVFQLNFSNSELSTFAQTAAGGLPDSLFLGFNLTRKFF